LSKNGSKLKKNNETDAGVGSGPLHIV